MHGSTPRPPRSCLACRRTTRCWRRHRAKCVIGRRVRYGQACGARGVAGAHARADTGGISERREGNRKDRPQQGQAQTLSVMGASRAHAKAEGGSGASAKVSGGYAATKKAGGLLFPDFDAGLQFLPQQVRLWAQVGQWVGGGRLKTAQRTLLSMSTSAAFARSLFEQTAVNSCSESSIRFVRGSSSRYCTRAAEPSRPSRRKSGRSKEARSGRREAGESGCRCGSWGGVNGIQGPREPTGRAARGFENAQCGRDGRRGRVRAVRTWRGARRRRAGTKWGRGTWGRIRDACEIKARVRTGNKDAARARARGRARGCTPGGTGRGRGQREVRVRARVCPRAGKGAKKRDAPGRKR